MSTGLSKTRLDHLHEVMARHVDDGRAPGLVTLVQRHGDAHVDAVGKKAIDGPPITRDTIFRIASMSKPVTAIAALILIEEGTLRLDDPVDELLPEFANRRVVKDVFGPLDDTVPAERSITTRDLLTFRAGYGMVWAMPGESPLVDTFQRTVMEYGPPKPASVAAPDDWLRNLAALPLAHQPGEQWLYNTGSDILGVLIARASGQSFDRFLAERIFEPLGMHDTGFVVPNDKRDRFATSYTTDPQDGSLEVFDTPDGDWATAPAFPSGAGGLVSTVDDFATFGQMLLSRGAHGGDRIVSRKSVELMTTDQLTAQNKATSSLVPGFWDDNGYGFGVSMITRRTGLESVGTYGWTGGLGTAWSNDPAEDLQLIILTQAAFTDPSLPVVIRDFITGAYAAIDD